MWVGMREEKVRSEKVWDKLQEERRRYERRNDKSEDEMCEGISGGRERERSRSGAACKYY
jgi:hypothetical protein